VKTQIPVSHPIVDQQGRLTQVWQKWLTSELDQSSSNSVMLAALSAPVMSGSVGKELTGIGGAVSGLTPTDDSIGIAEKPRWVAEWQAIQAEYPSISSEPLAVHSTYLAAYAALQDYLATDQARHAVQLILLTNVADGYYRLRELDERITLADRMIASHEETLRIFRRRVEVGSTSRFDLMQVQTLLNQAQSLSAQLQQTRAAQSHALTLLVGTPFDLNPARDLLNGAAATRALEPGLPSELLLHRPDIVAAEHRLQATEANIGAARAAFFPRITLTGSIGTASAELAGRRFSQSPVPARLSMDL
jgi:hypothetical protein